MRFASRTFMLRAMRSGSRGFTLVEVLVALAILAVLLLGATGIYWQQRRVTERMAAQRAADRALENTYEQLRLAFLPLVDETYPVADPPGGTVSVRVSAGTVPGTWQVDLVASYRTQRQPFRRTMIALVRP